MRHDMRSWDRSQAITWTPCGEVRRKARRNPPGFHLTFILIPLRRRLKEGGRRMFSIGEFSRIARVTPRQLRHYEELGLFQPERIDPETGYRFYSALQLARLNRILAFKELGLSLTQILRLLDANISAEEIRGMLTMR